VCIPANLNWFVLITTEGLPRSVGRYVGRKPPRRSGSWRSRAAGKRDLEPEMARIPLYAGSPPALRIPVAVLVEPALRSGFRFQGRKVKARVKVRSNP
jgi:hypothetical protein